MRKNEKQERKHRQRTAEGNLKFIMRDYPESKDKLNILLADSYLPDPFEKEKN
jgi:hypothetical protein